MIASLPMYWRAETAAAWRRFWRDVQAACDIDLPDLTAPEDLPQNWADHWRDPDLILSQTCSLPFRASLRDAVTYVGTFDFGLNAPIGNYYSRILCTYPAHDPRRKKAFENGWVLAYNAPDSQSGWAHAQAPTPFVRRPKLEAIVETGSHAASLAALAEGRATLAYIDAVTWRLLKAFDPLAKQVFLAGRSMTSPGLPLITAAGRDPEPLRRALKAATKTIVEDDRRALGGLRDFVVLDAAQYHALPVPDGADQSHDI